MMPAKGDQGTVRALNRRLLLRLLREQGPTSRTDLADQSGLSNGAVTRIVGELIDEGFLVEQSVGVSTGGRRPVLLDLDTSARVVAGLKLMDEAILAVLVDLKGNVVADGRAVLASHDTTVVLDQAVQAIEELLARAGNRDRLAGVGLCMPGAIDWRNGVCQWSPFFGWHDVPVAALLTGRLGVPVSVDNDVNALAVAESLFGRGRRVRDFAVITVGRGVGAGLVYNGAVYRGSSGGAGEFGHMVSERGGRLCECGKSGCLEAYVGEHALMNRVRELGGRYRELDLAGFLARAGDGDQAAADIYAEVTQRLGVAIANLINLLNPELVVLGGEAAFLSGRFLADLRPQVDAHTFVGLAGSFELALDDWRTDRTAWARGAASLAMEQVFEQTPVPALNSPH
jgi:predicted NBD/HSP70 family sugar kinase